MTSNSSSTSTPASDAAKARRLAFLLTQSVMPQEQKEAWIHLLPIMDSEQVDTLMGILEREYKGYQSASQDFLQDLKKLESNLQQQITSLKHDEQQLIEAYVKKAIENYDGEK